MSLLHFDALGHFTLGHPPAGSIVVLPASAGSFTLTGNAATFPIAEAAGVGAFAVTGVSATFRVTVPETFQSFAVTGNAAPLVISLTPAPGAFTLNGQPANKIVFVPEPVGAFRVTSPNINLVRTGSDYEFKLGGIGHYKLELERARQLAAITRVAPPPLDRRTTPQFPAMPLAPVAPAAQPIDMAALEQHRMAAEMQAVHAAKERREIEAILLLAA